MGLETVLISWKAVESVIHLIEKGVLILFLCLKVDVTKDYTENDHSLKLNENKEISPLLHFVNNIHEKSRDCQVTTDDCVEENEKTDMIMGDDLTVDGPALKPQSLLISTDRIGLKKVFTENFTFYTTAET